MVLFTARLSSSMSRERRWYQIARGQFLTFVSLQELMLLVACLEIQKIIVKYNIDR